jgi:mRNA interferase RelE/StbE
MIYQIEFSRQADKQLNDLDKDLQQQISTEINALSEEPRPSGSRKLKGSKDLYRLRVRDYRVIYQIQDKKLLVLIVKIKHGREVYRSL